MINSFKSMIYEPAKLFIVISVLIFSACVWWSSTAEIEEVVNASGKMVSLSGTQVIQATDHGVLASIDVHEGQEVKQGQILGRLQRERADAAFKDSNAKVAALRAALSRLHAEVYGTALTFETSLHDYPEFISNQTELFHRRQRALNEGLQALKNSRNLASAELAIISPLLGSGDVGESDVLRLRRQVAELDGQIVNMKNKYFQDAQAEMTKAEEELSTREQELADRAEVLDRTELIAPMDGVVRNIEIRTIGASVHQGDIVMQLVPAEANSLLFEAKLRPADIAFVTKGAPASVKLDAFDYSIYGMLDGKVSYISPDALTEETSRGEETFYLIRISLGEFPPRFKDIDLQSGNTGIVDIKTGKKTILSFLTKPIIKTFNESLRER